MGAKCGSCARSAPCQVGPCGKATECCRGGVRAAVVVVVHSVQLPDCPTIEGLPWPWSPAVEAAACGANGDPGVTGRAVVSRPAGWCNGRWVWEPPCRLIVDLQGQAAIRVRLVTNDPSPESEPGGSWGFRTSRNLTSECQAAGLSGSNSTCIGDARLLLDKDILPRVVDAHAKKVKLAAKAAKQKPSQMELFDEVSLVDGGDPGVLQSETADAAPFPLVADSRVVGVFMLSFELPPPPRLQGPQPQVNACVQPLASPSTQPDSDLPCTRDGIFVYWPHVTKTERSSLDKGMVLPSGCDTLRRGPAQELACRA